MQTDLQKAQRDQFASEGYFVVENLLGHKDVKEILDRIDEYARNQRAVPEGIAVQLEPNVVRGQVAVADRATAVRAIKGTVPRDEVFTRLAMNPLLVRIMQGLLGENLKLFRDAVLMKPPGIGSAKGVHQDSPYFPIEPMNLASCWIALDPATQQNGCMQVIPSSHSRALPHARTTDDYVIPEENYDAAKLLPVEMKSGDGLVFHSLLIHGTAPNTSSKPRRAITLSYMSSDSRYTGPAPKPDYFRISGEDIAGGV